MNNLISNLETFVRNNFTLYTRLGANEIYFCTCKTKNVVNAEEADTFYMMQSHDIDTLDAINLETAFRKVNFECSGCKASYLQVENYSKIKNIGEDFLDKFDVYETDDSISLVKLRVNTILKEDESEYETLIDTGYIKIDKNNKSIEYKPMNNPTKEGFSQTPRAVELSDVVKLTYEFFENGKNTVVTDGFINIHDFLGRISRLIMDSNNMNIIEELMGQMIGKAGISVLQKVLSIMLGILCYPNLSTISLTKGNIFLYNLLEKYPLPSIEYLKEQNATSPIKIFNTLVSLKNKDLQKNLDKDDTEKMGYMFKSAKGKEYLIKYDLTGIKTMDEADKLLKSGAKIFVRDKIDNRQISNFIFNKLKTLEDYENIIQWLKFMPYEGLIQLVMEHEIAFLNIVFSKIEFRDDITPERIKQFIALMLSYAELQLSENGKTSIKTRINKLAAAGGNSNFKYEAVKYFDFNLYDDCFRMLVELNWKPEKVLYKTKDFTKLIKLHEDLLKFRSFVSEKDLNEKYIVASEKYRYLEGVKTNDNDYLFDIKLIATPMELMNEAIEMHNCAGSYINKVAKNIYIPFILYDNSPDRVPTEFHKYMMIFEVTTLGLELVGVKSRFNKYGSDRFKNSVIKYLIDTDISFKEVPSIRTGVQSSETSYEGTFAKVSHLNAE